MQFHITRSLLLVAIVLAIAGFAEAKPFSKTVSLYGVTFSVKSPNKSFGNTVTITSKGLTRNLKVTKNFNGEVLNCDIGDSNLDRNPEVYVWGGIRWQRQARRPPWLQC